MIFTLFNILVGRIIYQEGVRIGRINQDLVSSSGRYRIVQPEFSDDEQIFRLTHGESEMRLSLQDLKRLRELLNYVLGKD